MSGGNLPPFGTKPQVTILTAPKDSNTDTQNEDAASFSYLPDSDPPILTVAVADGASSAIFAREWATLLTEEFSCAPAEEISALNHRLRQLGRRWRENAELLDLPWYAEEKMAQGSAAALLIVRFDLSHRRYRARAVGDTCLFVLRRDTLVLSFSRTHSDQFDDRPDLLTTNPPATDPTEWREMIADYLPGDRFWIATDALAAFLLAEHEKGQAKWHLPDTDPDFREWLRLRREAGTIHNDDTTLVRITLPEP